MGFTVNVARRPRSDACSTHTRARDGDHPTHRPLRGMESLKWG